MAHRLLARARADAPLLTVDHVAFMRTSQPVAAKRLGYGSRAVPRFAHTGVASPAPNESPPDATVATSENERILRLGAWLLTGSALS